MKRRAAVLLAAAVGGIVGVGSAWAEEREGEALLERVASLARLSVGAYGELTYAHPLEDEAAHSDLTLQRYSLLLGYAFSPYVTLSSELELREQNTTSDMFVEEMTLSVAVSDAVALQVGRLVIPSSLDNLAGEPASYAATHRSRAAGFALPAGWGDGLGAQVTLGAWTVIGQLTSGVDMTGFNALDGFASVSPVRQEGGTDDPAFSLHASYVRPSLGVLENLYLGAYVGRTGGNNGAYRIDVLVPDEEATSMSLDLGATLGPVRAAAFVGQSELENARWTERMPERVQGMELTLEVAFWPAAWASDRWEDARLVPHLRYDRLRVWQPATNILGLGTPQQQPWQPDMGAGDRTGWTVGCAFYPLEAVALKLDYGLELEGGEQTGWLNAGLGWQF